ncbi:MAG: hypothetical protein P8Q26_16145 [Ascidiaceihabitans sp.]|nr:hypothetical protein [Ascidiaceihabitans sp.]
MFSLAGAAPKFGPTAPRNVRAAAQSYRRAVTKACNGFGHSGSSG